MISRHRFSLGLLAFVLIALTSGSAFGAATIVIQNGDGAGVGFNDSTPMAPVGGNAGTTLGQQRLNAFQAAANIWGATLNSTSTITVLATWENLACTSNSAVLGSAGTLTIFREFTGATFPGTWYGAALANKLFGSDLDGGAEIRARFNVNLGNAGCLDGTHYYLGLDNNHGSDIDLVSVLIHEFSHGLGFQTFTNSSTGVQQSGFPTIYDRFLTDHTSGKTWIQMTDAERQASAINTLKLSWNGFQVTSAVPSVLTGTPTLKVNTPAAIAGNYQVGTASFGPALSSPGITADVVQALDPIDGAGPSTTDGCSALTNPGAVSGNIALIDRGTCTFVTKVKNAQNAGAVGVIIVDNMAGSPPPGLGGTDASITIPSVRVTLADGTTIRNQLGSGVNASLTLNLAVRPGADSAGRALLYAPNPFEGGSSVSHWDTSAFPNQLMEPNINGDLTHSVTTPQDLTYSLLRDVGWVLAADTNVQFSASNYNVGEGDGKATITVSRSGDTTGASTVDFATSNGTASQKSDYIVRSGTLTFAAGVTSRTFSVPLIDDVYAEGNETINLTLSNPVGAVVTAPSTATITIADNDAAGPSIAQKRFGASFGGAEETPPNASLGGGQGYVLLNAAETSANVSLQFLNLGSAETAAHIHGPVPSGTPGPIIFPLNTTNPVVDQAISPTPQNVADLKNGLHYINIHSNNFPLGEIRGQLLWNPTMEGAFFVRQHYLDFLGREPDAAGLQFWLDRLNLNCVSGSQCFHDNTVGVSDAFFFEPEFHQTAGFVFLVYRAAYGNTQPFHNPDGSNPAEANKLPEYGVFTADRARVVGGANLSASQQAFANLFVTRAEFTSKYGAGLNTGALFVDAVLANIQADDNVNLTSQRQALIDQYNTAGGGNGGRAQVMYLLGLDDAVNNPINNRAFVNAEYNRQFALTLYFGYLRRNPDIAGFLFWQGQINLAPVGDVPKQQALVCSFVTAPEYEFRFGPNAPRNNRECPQ
jgi:hypothetical protein